MERCISALFDAQHQTAYLVRREGEREYQYALREREKGNT